MPRDLYGRPANVFVAGFIDSPAMNLVRVQLTADAPREGSPTGRVPGCPQRTSGASAPLATIGFRPEVTSMMSPETGIPFEGTVVEELGADVSA